MKVFSSHTDEAEGVIQSRDCTADLGPRVLRNQKLSSSLQKQRKTTAPQLDEKARPA
jgi:hypothetical protein